jgi:LysW-gamma-L-lysine carboxypeptidase
MLQSAAAAWNEEHAATAAFDTLAPSLRAIQSRSDGFVAECEMTIGYRLPPGLDIAAMIREIETQALASGGRMAYRGAEPAFRASRRGPLVSAFVRALRAEGLEPAFKLKTGTSDMNVVGPVWNCPIVAYGPGNAALDHTPNEHILRTEYHRGIAVLERVLADLVAMPSADREVAREEST